MPVPTQESADFDDPREHLAWGLVHMPSYRGAPALTHPTIIGDQSEHLYELGFVHVGWLAGLADPDGNIHVDQLPKQQKKFQAAHRGPRHAYNGATKWVSMDTPAPKTMRIADINKLTPEENAAMIAQYRAAGMIPDPRPVVDLAQVE